MAATVSPAREVAYAVLRRVFEGGAYADRALHAEAARAGLDARDRALATRIAYGTVQRRATLDHVIARLARRPPDRLDAPVLAALRLGLFQLAYLDQVPPHAAVGEAVELAKRDAPRGAGLVNAVLRRGAIEARQLIEELPDRTPAEAAIRHSVPRWLAELWWDELGAATARALLASANEPGETAVRANTLRTTPDALAAELAALGVATRPAPGVPDGLVLETPWDVRASHLHATGLLLAQSRASMLAGHVAAPEPGERVLDLCAAPGGKTTHLAALMANRGELVAVERHAGRAAELRETCARLGATVTVVEADAAELTADRPFDRVLVDPPCSGLGTLRGRPDLRWRVTPETIRDLARIQQRILAAAIAALRPGGLLTYSVCTISRAEGAAQVAAAGLDPAPPESLHPVWNDARVDGHLQTLPHRDGTDGFFIARLRKPAR